MACQCIYAYWHAMCTFWKGGGGGGVQDRVRGCYLTAEYDYVGEGGGGGAIWQLNTATWGRGGGGGLLSAVSQFSQWGVRIFLVILITLTYVSKPDIRYIHTATG